MRIVLRSWWTGTEVGRRRPCQSRSAQALKRAAVSGNPASSNFARNCSIVMGGFFKASLCTRAAAQKSATAASRSSEKNSSG